MPRTAIELTYLDILCGWAVGRARRGKSRRRLPIQGGIFGDKKGATL